MQVKGILPFYNAITGKSTNFYLLPIRSLEVGGWVKNKKTPQSAKSQLRGFYRSLGA